MLLRLAARLLTWLGYGKEPFPSPDPKSWRFAVLPDTQIYALKYPELFEAQTRWLAEHAKEQGILFVLHEGDVVNDNNAAQWEAAARALRRLDGRVPYVLALGNHDYGPKGCASDRGTLLHEHLPFELFSERPSFGGAFLPGRIDNSYHVFETPSGPWLVLALEFGPRDEVVEWADGVLREHAEVPAILLTHAYLYCDGTRYDRASRPDQKWSPYEYGISKRPGGVNDGEQLFQRLVRRHDCVQLVFNGHVLDEGTARLTSAQDGGSTVHQILANYQHRSRGGDGYLRLVEIDAARRRVRVRTYSPVLDTYRWNDADDFDLPLPQMTTKPS